MSSARASDERLAHLQRHQQGDVLAPGHQQLEGAAQDLTAFPGIGRGPGVLRGDRGIEGFDALLR